MRVPSPRALLLASLALTGVTLVGAIAFVQPRSRPQPPAAAPSPQARPQPFAVVGATAQAEPYAATLTWTTPAPSTARIAWGPTGTKPLLWTEETEPSTSHSVELEGLTSASSYDVTIQARSAGGEAATASLAVTTPPAPAAVTGSVRGGIVLVNGRPFFPLLTWQECPGQWAADLRDGIDLFGGNPCTGLPNLLDALHGRALAAGTPEDTPGTTGPGLLGWFFPDEADARGLTGVSLPAPAPGLRFLTLTSHFFSGAAPLPEGRSIYPGLVERADVVGFDLYPLQELCRPDMLPAVYDAQRELVRLAGARATFQWIEEREMKCAQPDAAVTPATIRVESWLAIAGGAHGLGFFPPDWDGTTGSVIRGITARIRQLEPALLQPTLPVSAGPAATAVRASGRELGGAFYVLAVNAGATAASVRLAAPQLADRPVEVAGGDRQLQAADGVLADVLPPLSVRIYVAPPTG